MREPREQQTTDLGETEKVQQLEPVLTPSEFYARDSFHASEVVLLERRLSSAFNEIGRLRDALEGERATRDELLAQLAEWRHLAFRYGTQTEAEKRVQKGTLWGKVEIARDLVMRDEEAITHACASLAKKLRGALKHPERAPVPAVELSRSPPHARNGHVSSE